MSDNRTEVKESDENIIGLFFSRSEKAISLFQNKYGSFLLRIAFNILGSDEDAEECVNDTYLKLWNAIPPEKPENLKAYSSRIVRNLALNKGSYQSAGKRVPAHLISSELDEDICSEDSLCEADPESIGDLIDSFLRKIGKDERIAFILRYYRSESIGYIAEKFGCKDEKIKSCLFRTRKKLKAYLEKEGIRL